MAEGVVTLLDQLQTVPTDALDEFEPWHPAATPAAASPLPWVRDRERWQRAMAAVAGPLPASAAPLQAIHRDCNPGNLLWWRDRVTGVVDWVHLCRGPIEEDVARCRVNVALVGGMEAADRFLARVRAHGLRYDPVWDLAVLAEMAPSLEDLMAANHLGATVTLWQLRTRAEALVAAAPG